MSGEERHRKSRFGVWVFVILTVPVLYLLSVPPVILLTQRATPPTHNNGLPPPWLEAYSFPHNWLYLNTPLKTPMDAYANWWGKLMRVC
jgi:hypothetical protein